MGTRQDGPSRPSVMLSLVMLVAIVPFTGALFYAYHLLGIGAAYAGFLFLLYWLGVMHQAPSAFLPSLLGALGGVGLAWMLMAMPPLVGPAGMPIAVVLLALVIFAMIRGHVPVLVNNATMLFLTVATMPQVDIARNALELAASISVAALYTGGMVWLGKQIVARRQAKNVGAVAVAAA